VPGRNLSEDLWRVSHSCDLCRRKNLGRWTRPRVRRALATPEHALGAQPARAAPRRANPAPMPTPVAIKPTMASTVHPRASLTQPEHEIAGVCPENPVPAAAQATTTVDRLNQPSSAPSDPWVSFYGPSEASRAEDWTIPHRRRRIDVARHQMAAVAHRPSSTVSHSLIPCTYSTLGIPWSSLCQLIEPYRCEQDGAHAADEPDHLRTRSALSQPSPSTICTSSWPPGPPGPHPALHWTSLAAGKPHHPFSSPRLLLQGEGARVERKKSRGVFARSVTQRNSSAGVRFKGLVKGKPRGLGTN
jgi:hypothetical protein